MGHVDLSVLLAIDFDLLLIETGLFLRFSSRDTGLVLRLDRGKYLVNVSRGDVSLFGSINQQGGGIVILFSAWQGIIMN